MDKKMNGVAIVTGGSQGIGYAIAQMFLVNHGYSVAICGRNEATVKEAERRLQENLRDIPGTNIYCEAIDIGTQEAAQGFIQRAEGALGGIDVLVNNAAHIVRKRYDLMTIEDLTVAAGVNILAPWVCTLTALPYLLRSDIHTIVNLSSEMDQTPLPEFAVYASCKGGITSFTKALAVDFPASMLRVLGIRPRRVDTRAWHRVRANDKAYYSPEDVANLVEHAVFALPKTDTGVMLNLKDYCGGV